MLTVQAKLGYESSDNSTTLWEITAGERQMHLVTVSGSVLKCRPASATLINCDTYGRREFPSMHDAIKFLSHGGDIG